MALVIKELLLIIDTKRVPLLSDLKCWISTVYCSHRGLAVVRHEPVGTLQDTHFGMCHRLGNYFPFCIVEAPLPPRFLATSRTCHQKMRRHRLRRSIVHQEHERCAMSWHSSSPSSLTFLFGTRRDGLCSLSQRRRSVFLRPRPRPQVKPCAGKGHVGEVLRCCPGKVHLPCLRFVAVRNVPGCCVAPTLFSCV